MVGFFIYAPMVMVGFVSSIVFGALGIALFTVFV
jgi:hypothetical protein